MSENIKIFIKLLLGKDLRGREFKQLIDLIAPLKNQKVFELLVRKFDPSLKWTYVDTMTSKRFLDQGKGLGTLKPYRVLKDNKTKVFEKIFFNTSHNLKAALFFDKNKGLLLNNLNIRSPRLISTYSGENLTVLLYEYWDLYKLPIESAYEVLKAKTLELSQGIHADEAFLQLNPSINSSIGTKIYNPRPDLFIEEFKTIEKLAQSFPVYFQHLDLGEENVYLNNVIIDWDNSGFYNLGVDFGRLLLSNYILNSESFVEKYKVEIADYHEKLKLDIHFDSFYLVVLFYFLSLFYGHHKTEHAVGQINEVVEEFKNSVMKLSLSENIGKV
ncbi:hypothetical protein [Anditalea andensis]|uniref:Aminoglycoside phosphotransferase domain-containing protein n=1 Tax=Anditalea andensis TaxID=1048983 RepID=A0A074KS66_9BACT|nr:hypothetical protein [Anditalea andensis]KEO71749.1 hypothetical protein EL17_21425 [Anditalea andensis]